MLAEIEFDGIFSPLDKIIHECDRQTEAVAVQGFICCPVQRSVVPPLQAATTILNALNKLNVNRNLR